MPALAHGHESRAGLSRPPGELGWRLAAIAFVFVQLVPGAGGAGTLVAGEPGFPHERLPLELRVLPQDDSLACAALRPGPAAPPRARAWDLSGEQSMNNGTGGPGLLGSGGAAGDAWAGGADTRGMPGVLLQIIGHRRLGARGHFDPLNQDFSRDTVQLIGRAFANQWTPVRGSVGPDGAVTQRFGEDFRLLGRVLEVDESAHWRRGHSLETSSERLYLPDGSPLYDYLVERGVASTRLGGTASLGLSLTRGQSVRARATYDRDADDEGRSFGGTNALERGLNVSGDRLMYVQRVRWSEIASGEHALGARGPTLTWSAGSAGGYRVQPDRREALYLMTSVAVFDSARREFGDAREHADAFSLGVALPLPRGGERGSLRLSWERESHRRDRAYRRFDFQPALTADALASPESLFAPGRWATYSGALINESTLNTDNGWERWRQDALAADLVLEPAPALQVLGGARGEHAVLESASFLPWSRGPLVNRSRLDDMDWLPSMSIAWRPRPTASLRLTSNRVVSRPSLDEFSPASRIDLRDGIREQGNPALRAGRMDGFALSCEAAAADRGVTVRLFRTQLHAPIEQRISGSAGAWRKSPVNSGEGWDEGAILGLRARLGFVARALALFSMEARVATAASRVAAATANPGPAPRHPWVGSAGSADASLSWSRSQGGGFMTLKLHHEGERLETLGAAPRPDLYACPVTTLSARVDLRAKPGVRFALSGDNLTDAALRTRQGGLETYNLRPGPTWAATLTLGR